MTYEEYIAPYLVGGFSYSELVKPAHRDPRGRFKLPPKEIWHNITGACSLANTLRSRMMTNRPHDCKGVRIAAAYRPDGGAPGSKHKVNAALDLDILGGQSLWSWWYETALEVWREYGDLLNIGLGLYMPAGRRGGARIHIDTGQRTNKTIWQMHKGEYIRPPYRGDSE